MQPVAYIRKSVVHVGARTMSWEVQEGEVRAMAERYGDKDLTILSDWGKSGRKGAAGRAGYRDLIERIEAGKVSAVYAYSLSRLSRSLADYAALAALCATKKVPIRLAKEGEQDFASPHGRLIAHVLAATAQMEAELAQERARDLVMARRSRGDQIGRERYGMRAGEDIALVVAAFKEAGSFHGAARLLTERGVPTRLGRPWRPTTVRVLLEKYAPIGTLPMGQVQRAKTSPRFRLARLLRCHCGKTLTGVNQKGRPR
jgi:DNA invertase Pin-like site-specific DNA recombinase